MNKTYDDFLDALENFRKIHGGDENVDMEKDVVLKFIAFLKDKENKLLVLVDKENNTLVSESEYGVIFHLYTSIQDIFLANIDKRDWDYIVCNAFNIFSKISKEPNLEAVYINENKFPPVYIPKDIMELMLFRVDNEEEYQKILQEANSKKQSQ